VALAYGSRLVARVGLLAVLGALGVGACQGVEGALVSRVGDAATDAGLGSDAEAIQDGGGGASSGLVPGVTWQIQLTGTIDTSLDVRLYDLDLFEASESVIRALRDAGRLVVCYVSVGTAEDWRSDVAEFPSSAVGAPVVGYAGERWLDVRDPTTRTVMALRLDLGVSKGCQGIEAANLDGVFFDTGFPLTQEDELGYAQWIAAEGHSRGLSVGFSGGDQTLAPALAADFDWALTVGCLTAGTCAALSAFRDAAKARLLVEFGGSERISEVCPQATSLGLDAILKPESFDAARVACP
jgi:hypothetical protein